MHLVLPFHRCAGGKSPPGSVPGCRQLPATLHADSASVGNHEDRQQPPDFLILAARALSAFNSGTSLKHFSRHSKSLL